MAPSLRTMSLVLLIAGASLAPAKDVLPAVDNKWRFYRSPNFELFSRNNDRDSRELLHNLELLRAVFVERLHLKERARVEVSVIFFGSVDDFRAYEPAVYQKVDFYRGVYVMRPARAMILVAPMDYWESAQLLIFHEYVHHLFRATGEDPTVWFNEGMADMLSTIREEGGVIEIGRPNAGRLRVLQQESLLPLETLFSAKRDSATFQTEDHTGLFYAESWALLHYWYFGESGFSDEQVKRFLKIAGDRKSAEHADVRALFRECFGMDYPEMQRRLQQYVRGGRYRWGRQPVPKLEDEETYTVRAVPRDEMRVRLAEVAVHVNQSAAGKLVLLDAITKNAGDPRPFETLGTAALFEHDESAARQRWEQAISAGSQNPAILRELAVRETRDWVTRFDLYFTFPAETAERLRGRLLASIAVEPEQIDAYEMLAWVEAYAPEPMIANVNLVQKRFPTLHAQARTSLALAMVRWRLGKPDDAIRVLNELDNLDPDTTTRRGAEILRAKIEGRKPKRIAPVPVPRASPIPRPPKLELPGG